MNSGEVVESQALQAAAVAYFYKGAGVKCGVRKGQGEWGKDSAVWWIATLFPESLETLPAQAAVPYQGLTAYLTLTVTSACYMQVPEAREERS